MVSLNYLCPVCNGFDTVERACPSCHQYTEMQNQGRVVDFMGDYIPYLDYEGTNLIDGMSNSKRNHICLHLYHCHNCGNEFTVPIDELLF
ncbi:hypothetical protein [Aquibacillus salsiterrae]|uniref:Uncharacterized protein n=1 Tax=Aquibacillus salsiterrae TaxID=2950439 RepID=A0A9X3WF41_9BACI|nr:hypothetical protein [Aquibacillus salsiterrae]MDC3417291.1 hypothetical protein [Aquibacillus salsiterrae]